MENNNNFQSVVSAASASTSLPLRPAVPLTPATPVAKPGPSAVTDDTLITIRLYQEGHDLRRLKIALKDLGPNTLPKRIRRFIGLENTDKIIKIERFSDTTNSWVSLDNEEPAVYKQLFRAAKTKQKLRLRVTVVDAPAPAPAPAAVPVSDFIKPIKIETIVEPTNSDPVKLVVRGHKAAEKESLLAPEPTTKSPADIVIPPLTSESKTLPPTKPGDSLWPYYSIFCDRCDKSIAGEHRHCSVCSNGDYDLCMNCKNKHCNNATHFLITRTVDERGVIVASSTSKAEKKAKPAVAFAPRTTVAGLADSFQPMAKACPKWMEERYLKEMQALRDAAETMHSLKVTCNNCVQLIDPKKSFRCADCPDFDLCHACFTQGGHGHSEMHTFVAGDEELTNEVRAMLAPGRGVKHFAICDSCEKHIHGIRNKCSVCPDYDLCAKCFERDQAGHQHTFIPVVRPLVHQKRKSSKKPAHIGVTCDGPMCKTNKGYIVGDRYKCTICDDYDLCANCEAMPNSTHSETHPMIKMKRPLRGVDITTYEKADNGEVKVCGDYPAEKSLVSQSDLQPYIQAVNMPPISVANPSPEPEKIPEPAKPVIKPVDIETYDAWFVSDTISDGTFVHRGETVYQGWKMENPAATAWPKGTRLVLESGAYMLNLEEEDIQTAADLQHAFKTYTTVQKIEQGQSFTFAIALRAPQQAGLHRATFRMQTPDGVSFGPRVWCEINVLPQLVAPDASYELIADTEAGYTAKITTLEYLRNAYEREIAFASDVIADAEDSNSETVRKATAILKNRDYLLANVDIALSGLLNEFADLYPTAAVFDGEATQTAEAENVNEHEAQASQLILPALEKESPASSIHQEKEAETKDVKTEHAVSEHDDVRSVEAPMEDLDLDSSDGFQTDEEYDIVDDAESEW